MAHQIPIPKVGKSWRSTNVTTNPDSRPSAAVAQ
jgi:hypothetical protein